jgi:nuclear pore complex protein Nup205
MILGFLDLLNSLTDFPVPAGLGAGLRTPGFDPYLNFIRDDVFLKFDSRAYKDPADKVNKSIMRSSIYHLLVLLASVVSFSHLNLL